MRLAEVLKRSAWLELQQAFIDFGFEADLETHDDTPRLIVQGQAPGLDKHFEYRETFYPYFSGFWWSPLESKTQVPLSVQGALDVASRFYLDDLREHKVIEHSLLWLAENHKPLARKLVALLLEGKAQVELTVTTMPSPAIEAREEAGWELFARRDTMGVADLVFIKR